MSQTMSQSGRAQSYSSNYLKTFAWQGAAFASRFLSMFIVMPYLTRKPSIYGIYALCVSVTIFLNYADMGFLKASQKYATECFVKNDRAGEMKFIGFGSFVLLVFSSVCALVFLYLGYHPQALIRGLDTPEKIATASSLLVILAMSTPVTVLQRMMSIIFDIRLESYLYQKISLFGSIITIISVFYFFRGSNYQIVPYFIFFQVVTLFSVLLCLRLASTKYNYGICQLFKCVRFDRTLYDKSNKLAYSGLYVMLVWILFYELDQVTIAKLLGADQLAVYAIALTFATLFRSIFSILFSPFMVRANHFAGTGDDQGMKEFCLKLVAVTAPIVIFPTVAFSVIAKPFILCWVGEPYLDSVRVAQLLALVYALSFISYSTSIILTAKERIREIYVIATILPAVFWLGVFCTYSFHGLIAFAEWKLMATLLAEAFYLYILLKYLGVSLADFVRNVIRPLVIPVVVLITFLVTVSAYLPHEKSKANVLFIILTTGAGILSSLALQFHTSLLFRTTSNNVLELFLGADLFGRFNLRRFFGIKGS